MLERDPGGEPVKDRANCYQALVHAEIRTQEPRAEVKKQYTKSNNHRKHDQISSNGPQLSPRTGPRVYDEPKEQPRRKRDDAQDSENISNMIDHGGPTRIALEQTTPSFAQRVLKSIAGGDKTQFPTGL